jgi:hypothetical protein
MISVVGQIQTGNVMGYSKDIDVFPETVEEPLFSLKSALGGKNTIPAPLLVDPSLAAEPWEALVQLRLQSEDKKDIDLSFVFWRTTPQAGLLRLPETSWEKGHVAVFSSPSWHLLVEDGWRPLRRTVQTFVEARSLPDAPLKVLHLIGTPTSTSSGKFIHTARGDYIVREHTRQEASSRAKAAKTSRRSKSRSTVDSDFSVNESAPHTSRAGQAILSLEQVPVIRAALVIVQGEPAEVFSRVRKDRENMRHLRQFGADLFDAGAQIVLVLPVLPTDLTRIVLQQFARELDRIKEVDADVLARGIARIQKTIVQWSPQPDSACYAEYQKVRPEERWKTRLEQAFDITLFCAQGLDVDDDAILEDLIGGYNE